MSASAEPGSTTRWQSAVYGYRRLVEAQVGDLRAFALAQGLFLAVALFAAKWLAVGMAYRGSGAWERLAIAVRVMPAELTLVAALLLLALLVPRPRRVSRLLRLTAAAGLVAAALLLTAVAFVNVEFFGSWGAPLSWELVRLGPHLAGYILMVGTENASRALQLWALLSVAALLLGPLASAALARVLERPGRRRALAAGACLALAFTALQFHRAAPGFREDMLRRLNPVALLWPSAASQEGPATAPASPHDAAALRELLGPASGASARTLAPLRGRHLNVVLWVWESVSARYLRSLHPLGLAATPQLDRLVRRGGVVFSRAYTECPLTVQTTWALITGLSPPAKPFVFVDGERLPPHGPALQGELERAGYHTGAFYSSYPKMWRTQQVFDIAPFDVFEDADTLAATGRYARNGVGVQDEAPVERSLEWIDGLPPGEVFFALLWNTETHRPYTWAGMPPELEHASDLERFVRAIERSDSLLGRFADELAKRGLAENTLIVVVGDHGEAFGRPPWTWDSSHSGQVFEDDIHVPLIFLHPDLTPTRVDTLVTHTDIYPTLLDLLGRPVPAGLDGQSLARVVQPRAVYSRSILWWPMAIRAGRYKLILDRPGGRPLLFDVHADPQESVDLYADDPEIRRVLGDELYRWHAQRFRSDVTFGYRFPEPEQTLGDAPRSLEWRQ